MLPIYRYLKNKFNIDDFEMLTTFNMGVGIALVTNINNEKLIIEHFKKFKINAYRIGKIISRKKEVEVINQIQWK